MLFSNLTPDTQDNIIWTAILCVVFYAMTAVSARRKQNIFTAFFASVATVLLFVALALPVLQHKSDDIMVCLNNSGVPTVVSVHPLTGSVDVRLNPPGTSNSVVRFGYAFLANGSCALTRASL